MITWQEVDELIQRAQQPLDDPWLEKLNRDCTPPQPYYRFLYLLAEKLHPPLALEIGVYTAVASAHLAAGLAAWDGQVIGLDINPVEPAETIKDRYGNYWFLQADASSTEAIAYTSMLIDRYGALGIVYQDSSHHYYPSLREWAIYSTFCQSDGVWLCDDILPCFSDPKVDPPGKSMVSYWETLPEPKRLFPQVLHIGNTMGLALLDRLT